MTIPFDLDLIRRHGGPGPRYTSYPSAPQFTDRFGAMDYQAAAERCRVARPGAPLSVYVHVPFCASPCFYCACNRIITRQPAMAAAYLKRLVREIELQGALFERRQTVEQLHLGGGTPTFFTLDQLGCVIGSLDRHLGLTGSQDREYSIEIDPRTISAAMLPALAGLGFNRLSLGVQDFDPRVQQAVNRRQSARETLDLMTAARSCGFRSVSVDLMYGLPFQTQLSWESTLRVMIAARPDRIAAYGYAHLPALFKAQQQIRAEDLPSPEERLQLLELTIRTLTDAGYVYIGMDHFALPGDELAHALRAGTLQRNFQGYSTRRGLDLVGLGLSAIGALDDSYSQNPRQLDRYYAALDAGALPVERGLRLTRDDRIRRDIIMALMCQNELAPAAIEQRYGIVFDEHFTAERVRLRALARDGLVTTGEHAIRVTPRGRFLIRAVAQVFDAYLPHRAAAGARRHSTVV